MYFIILSFLDKVNVFLTPRRRKGTMRETKDSAYDRPGASGPETEYKGGTIR